MAPIGVRLVAVCRANIARSPLAEVALRRTAAEHGFGPLVDVLSAGVAARTGRAAAPESVAIAAGLGVDLSGHRAAHVDDVGLGADDVVVTMSLAQRDHLHRLGVPPDHVFTLLELAALLEAREARRQGEGSLDAASRSRAPGRALLDAVEEAAALRPVVAIRGPLEIADPYRRGEQAYAEAWGAIRSGVGRVGSVFARAVGAPGSRG